MSKYEIDDSRIIFSGNCEFIVEDQARNFEIRFKVIQSSTDKHRWFVNVFKGDNKTLPRGWYLIGFIDQEFSKLLNRYTPDYEFLWTYKSCIPLNSPEVKFMVWFMWHFEDPKPYKLYHTGLCARCGRKLRDLKSLEIGLGPNCRRI